jgi:hypothetical protein
MRAFAKSWPAAVTKSPGRPKNGIALAGLGEFDDPQLSAPGAISPGREVEKLNIQHTVRYTELAPDRFKNFWR